MKKYTKVISIVLTILLLVACMATTVLAKDPSGYTGDTSGEGITEIEDIGKQIIGIIQVVGSLAAVAVLVILGIKYMMGSAQEKAEYKKTLIPYIIGAILIFAASNLAGVIYGWASGVAE